MQTGTATLTGLRLVSILASLIAVTHQAVHAVDIDFVTVGNPGNPADANNGFGNVNYVFQIGRCDVTNGQYVEFLNKVEPAGDDSELDLFVESMMTDPYNGGINHTADGSDGAHYSNKAGLENKPVVYVSFYSVMRFANWLHNGQPTGGGTESGVYDLTAGGNLPLRNGSARFWIPTENEWCKAAYYDPTKVASNKYYLYATRSDSAPEAVPPTGNPNSANYYGSGVQHVTDVGAYTLSRSYYGTADQSGNVFNWNESPTLTNRAYLRGGSWANLASVLSSTFHIDREPQFFGSLVGFRVATTAPVPVLKVTGISRTADGHVFLQGAGAPSVNYRVMATIDLSVAFTQYGTVTTSSDGTFLYEDKDAGGTSKFYRIAAP